MAEKSVFVAQMLKSLGITKEEADKALDMLSDQQLGKAMHSEAFGNVKEVTDRWHEGQMHKVPGADVIKVGPSQESSGGGAEHMIRDYSNPAPQHGIQVEAERLAAELGQMRGYMKAFVDGHNGLCTSVDALLSMTKGVVEQNRRLTIVCAGILAKAEEKEDEEDKEEDKTEKAHAEKANAYFTHGQKLLRKAKKRKGEAKACSEEAAKASLKQQANLLRKAGLRQIAKAQSELAGLVSESVAEARKAIDIFFAARPALKADMDKMDEEKEDEEKKAKKARKAFKKAQQKAEASKGADAHKDATGNQADKKDPQTGNQDDTAVKAAIAEMSTRVESALTGLGMLKTDIGGLFDVLAGKPVNTSTGAAAAAAGLQLMKGDVEGTIRSIDSRITDAADKEILDQTQEHRARDLLSKLSAVNAGHLDRSIWDQQLNQAPHVVQDLFRVAA